MSWDNRGLLFGTPAEHSDLTNGRVTAMEKIRLGWNERKRQPLRGILWECRYRKATDPRDKIFSVLGLIGDHMNPYLQPDYTKPVGQVKHLKVFLGRANLKTKRYSLMLPPISSLKQSH